MCMLLLFGFNRIPFIFLLQIPDKKIAKSGVGSKEKTKNSRKPDGLMARQGDLLEDKKDRGKLC